MLFTPLKLAGAFLIEPERLHDQRGFFARSFCEREFADRGLNARFVQNSISFNTHKATLRGMHFQKEPHEEIKIVTCTQGSVFDVIIDLRANSATRWCWEGVELSAENKRMLYVPKGFAQGFITLETDTQLLYQISEFYAPGAAAGVRWDDPAFNIKWPLEPKVVADRDMSYALWSSEQKESLKF